MGHHSGIGVLDKAVQVLEATTAAPSGLADLCAATGLPRATAHRLAVGLEVHGLLTRDSNGRWCPGPYLAVLAADAVTSGSGAPADVLPRLRDRTGESVQVYRPDGLSRICVAVAEADPATQRALLPDATFTERTLAEVRRRGWAQSVAEREAGVASVSAPVRDPRGSVIAAVSVSGPVERIGRRPGARWAGDLVEAADALTARL